MTSMSRALMGYIVDEVFDGAIEDTKVIEDIYAAIKRHEALSASPAGVKPKALEWEGDEYVGWTARDAGHLYEIDDDGSDDEKDYTLEVVIYGRSHLTRHETLEAAKSAAQADYSARIMSAIEPAGEPIGYLKPEADQAIEPRFIYARDRKEFTHATGKTFGLSRYSLSLFMRALPSNRLNAILSQRRAKQRRLIA